MKIEQLLVNIKNSNFNMEKELQVKKYLSMEEKKLIAQGIIYECTSNTDGFIKVDSVQQYLSYIKFMIKRHTNLEYAYEDYDVLCSTEYKGTTLLNAIMDSFGSDAQECSRILNFMLSDYLQENSIESTVGKFVNNLNMTIGNLAEKLESKVDELNVESILPAGVDVNNINKFLNTYIK